MKLFLYILGAMAQVGVYVTIAAALWFLTNMEVLEIVSITAAVGTTIAVLVFLAIEEIFDKGRVTNDK